MNPPEPGEQCVLCGHKRAMTPQQRKEKSRTNTGEYDPSQPIERVPEEQLMKEEPEVPERQVEDGSIQDSERLPSKSAIGSGGGRDSDSSARQHVSAVRPRGAKEGCDHDWEVSFIKSMGRNKRACKKCRETELV